MIKALYYFFIDDITQQLHIHYVAGCRIGHACKLHDQIIIVSVKMRVIAFAKHRIIPLLVPCRIVQAVRGIKVFFSKNRNPQLI